VKSNEVKKKIFNNIKEFFLQDGFVYKKTLNEFTHQIDDYSYIYNIHQVSWGNRFSLHVNLGLSQKQIEDIIEKILGKRQDRLTFWRDIGDIAASPDGREVVNGNLSLWIYDDADVDTSINQLKKYYSDIAKQYFLKYNSLESIDDVINNPPFSYCPAHVGGSFDDRCMKGLVVASLVGNSNYQKLVEIYNEEIKETKKNKSINDYYKVVQYLEKHNLK